MQVKVAAIQMAVGDNEAENIDKALQQVHCAADAGANIILLQELFSTPYFCKDQNPDFLALAQPRSSHPALLALQKLAKDRHLVLPVSFFERANNAFFNSVVVFDADGKDLGLYRKAHIPDGPGYQEKFYFSPGDTGFKIFDTQYGRIGVAICWDQWFPEAARVMALQGAEILFYPTAIGSEPRAPEINSRGHWTRVMQGHAAANLVPLVAANRIGHEIGAESSITFYGGSFISDPTGALLAQADQEECILYADLDLSKLAAQRAEWGLFRDRRPELYAPILSLDGNPSDG
ncbi:N-carbamoylputrescine amidase [Acidithiobacillus thiooxidans]|uniref:N-carbamoylputrescine amidase n=1 Tax=Acidithiobacillus thiooxidans ATCC 19377 TaxID=637390 RepID=A0A5P9XU91_ACITH|nr:MULTISPECIES: N-carbamoylputrescine amidase [Acidithiobacillus]MBE7566275.1 N-carbamoylputrescine amidase [Acidithiobacillus sp. HP-11]MBU2742302.1 N-carbamoylputrescine amidase [Acidithiobacillus albertensis]MBU2750066.1 N-carbamoylputrescine amidase [Acidithiobacillus thiooxidans]MBU2792245.1 N-carbamoylputrescine amidase [Acidithiobacillus thiooxidans]MBU2836532.1 N-carbamoylputrescine amidase [Acidithiobacillus thiooxidans]